MLNQIGYEVSDTMKKKSIIEIFNEMEYEEEANKSQSQEPDELLKTNEKESSADVEKIKKGSMSFDNAVEAAVKAQKEWMKSSALKRADSLLNICKVLTRVSNKLSKSRKDALILLEYFNFYSDLAIQTKEYKSWRPQGVVLIVLSNYSPFFVLGTTVPAALATGCSVIVLAHEKAQVGSFFLKEIIAEAGLLEGLFNVVTEFDEENIPVSKKINKVFFCGSFLSAQKFYIRNLSRSFNFFCPNNTSAFILESCDLNAAVSKIVEVTWGKNSLFAVSTIIVQESIYEAFLKKMKYRIEQFMIENKNSSKFENEITADKINRVILEALNAGASVEKSDSHENTWSPTIIINYQNQNIDEDVPVLRVFLCRTAKEGVTLMNNCRYSLGASVWSEISSQALEVSSMLVCPNIWINCHGVFQASEPLQPSAFSGDCVLGGNDGILEYMSFTTEDPSEANKTNEDKIFNIDKITVLQTAAGIAQNVFSCWKNKKSRRNYIKDIAHALAYNTEFKQLSEMISTYAHFGNLFNFSKRNFSEKFLVVKEKVPIGVILLIVNTPNIDMNILVSLITLPLVLGNGVIIVLMDKNSSVKSLIECYNEVLPKNILSIFFGSEAGMYLAADPNIQAIWLFDETAVSTEFLQSIRNHSSRSLKHIWVIPKNISVSQHFFQKECLQNKVIWLTSIDQFP